MKITFSLYKIDNNFLHLQDNNKKQEEEIKPKKSNIGICFTTQTALYEKTDDVKEMHEGYTSDGNRLRNRVFIDNPRA